MKFVFKDLTSLMDYFAMQAEQERRRGLNLVKQRERRDSKMIENTYHSIVNFLRNARLNEVGEAHQEPKV